jgi:hypothetical protein
MTIRHVAILVVLAGCGSVTAAAPAEGGAAGDGAGGAAGSLADAGGASDSAGSSGAAGAAAGQGGTAGAAGASSGGVGGAPDAGPGTVSELPCPSDWTVGADTCPDVNGQPCRVCYENSRLLRCRTSSGVYCVPSCSSCSP